MGKKLVSINLDEELISEIDAIAENLGISRSAMVNLGMRGIVMGEMGETLGILAKAAKSKKRERKTKSAFVQ